MTYPLSNGKAVCGYISLPVLFWPLLPNLIWPLRIMGRGYLIISHGPIEHIDKYQNSSSTYAFMIVSYPVLHPTDKGRHKRRQMDVKFL